MKYARALVTGASRGIGRALALVLAPAAAEVVLAARRMDALETVAAEVRAGGGRARLLALDVRNTAASVTAIRRSDDEAPFDLVIACAGVGARRDAPPFAWEAIAEPFHTNFCGAAATLTALAPRMAERQRGHLVGISSIAALGALPEAAAYCAPKAGLTMLLECLRMDLRGHGVAVTAVHLGFVRTAMVANRTGPLPLVMDVHTAAERIVRALARRPARIDLPASLALAARAAAHWPRAVRDRLLRPLR